MPETAVEQCGRFDFLESQFNKSYSSENDLSNRITNLNSIQSDVCNKDKGEEENRSFGIILKQRVNEHNIPGTHRSHKPNGTTSVSDLAGLFQKNLEKDNPFEMQDTNLSDSPQSMEKNPNTLSSFMEKSEEFSNLMQKSEIGVEHAFPGNQIINIVPSPNIFSNTGMDYSINIIQNSNQSIFMKDKMVTTTPQFDIDKNFISTSNKNNYFSFSLSTGEINGNDSQQNEKFTDTNNVGLLFGTETNDMNSLTADSLLKRLDIEGEKLLRNSKNLQKMSTSVFGTMQESGFTGPDMDEINVRELPKAFKSQSHHIAPENMNTPFVQAVNVLTNTDESNAKSDLLKINGDISSKQNIPSVQQADMEGDLSGNFTTEQRNANHAFVDALLKKARSSLSYSANTQIITNGTQLLTTDFQQNVEVFSGNGIGQLFSQESRINDEIQGYYGSTTMGTENAHKSIVEQLSQKITMVNHGDRSEIKLHLTPPELGSVNIHFSEENDEIEAKIFVENAEVKAAIENNVHRLKEVVAGSGLEIHKLEVYIRSDKAAEEKFSENSETKNQQSYQTKSHEGSNGNHYEHENDITNTIKKEFTVKATNLMVDYII